MSHEHDSKQSSAKMSTLASKVLQDNSADQKEKSLAGSVLSQSEAHHEDSSDKDQEDK
ncbi:hypothetical protein [Saccharibacillus kuerlensis]|uniref:DUF4025 domain-containing protein n=1 Tax=Saccharibacillus kuerlensis TaxID=459527 RepID=A0ABQ2KXK9_9BACL|nr:hypothetical protein [Saccharibacillus kuerlensis]GGN95790.1 hypothetical protein GCM10010969_12020 [Saccharibacillus kuerlensis]